MSVRDSCLIYYTFRMYLTILEWQILVVKGIVFRDDEFLIEAYLRQKRIVKFFAGFPGDLDKSYVAQAQYSNVLTRAQGTWYRFF